MMNMRIRIPKAKRKHILAPEVMRYVAPGLYPAIVGSTPTGRTILQ